MLKNIFFIAICLLALSKGLAQGIVLGDGATLNIGGGANFFAGPNTTFNGALTNQGEIISFSDLDFVANRDVGSLRFVGEGDQNLLGDTLDVVDINVNKMDGSNVILLTDQVVVSGALNMNEGVIEAEDELDLLVQGSSAPDGEGFVEGKLVGLTDGGNVTFPMGLNGNPNYVTLTNVTVEPSSPGAIIRAECIQPDPNLLGSEEDVEDVSEDVEWILTSINGVPAEATVTVNFSGVNLQATSNINATTREPAILVLVPGDSLFRRLETNSITTDPGVVIGPLSPPSSAIVETTGTITVSNEPVRMVVAWVPVVDGKEFFVPNSFSPNALFEENRVFRPFSSGAFVTGLTMRVFNNLNVEVYSTSTSSSDGIDLTMLGWDGRLSTGQTAPGGVYYYEIVLVYNDDPEDTDRKAGSVLLVD